MEVLGVGSSVCINSLYILAILAVVQCPMIILQHYSETLLYLFLHGFRNVSAGGTCISRKDFHLLQNSSVQIDFLFHRGLGLIVILSA